MLRIDEVPNSEGFPDRCDVAVIGGGIIGVSTAYELARRGVSVVLLEKGIIGAEQSGRNWGWVRQQNRDLYELPLAMQSLKRWGELSDELGEDIGFRRSGILYASEQSADVAQWETWLGKARALGFDSQLLSARELAARVPHSRAKWAGGVWSHSDGRAEPSRAAPAIARGAQRLGARVHQTCAVRGLDSSAGRISGVWTERGRIGASSVVLAGGAWSALFCRHHGIDLPAVNVIGTALRTAEAPAVIDGCFSGPNFAMRRRLDGGYTIAVPGYGRMEIAPQNLRHAVKFRQMFRSKLNKKLKFRIAQPFFGGPEGSADWGHDDISPFEVTRVLNPVPDAEWPTRALQNVATVFPELSGLRIAHAWAGAIDTMPDLVPVMSHVESKPGLVIASGFSGHGFGLGPGAGMLVSRIVTDDATGIETQPYRLTRFSDGTRLAKPEMM
ncbi:glycine/D-amino acid oxidase-like deaminating enzyme [Paraburkholderia sp. HC6.4b]|uniref:NAD(P)/FAD-dependent oxidoreductase n=1 Tax=unclassified Paraburkholderia TaxID=2615204 RepID=UPI00160C0EF7|nr:MULTISPECIES: FAD-binding oxidoreductase [unclassified Paraburkholderia]MBB5413524.1 glycine/D-amino acid oxidase-like deaminating enzyme [Paraburkholderia sp. HC6.4b]MBB5455853.1 glycine/D-amino acid oxidase-like deaminating enzyme [Paraburkholderia sp. Kb1A]